MCIDSCVRISKQWSPLVSIGVACSFYTPEVDSIQITLRFDDIVRSSALIKEIGLTVGLTFVEVKVRFNLGAKGIAHLKSFCHRLKACELIGDDDTSNLKQTIEVVARVKKERLSITTDDSFGHQAFVIEKIALPHVGALIQTTPSVPDIGQILCCITKQTCREPCSCGDLFNSDLAGKSIQTLHRLWEGTMEFNSEFIQAGCGIPPLDYQRQILVDLIKKAFEAKYGPLGSNEFECFYIELALLWARKGRSRGKRFISDTYCIPCDSVFPMYSAINPRVETEGVLVKKFIPVPPYVPNSDEKQLLRRYGLQRFPKSLEDWPLALAKEPGAIIEDTNTLLLIMDGVLYPNLTLQQQLCCAIHDKNCAEVERISTSLRGRECSIEAPIIGSDTALSFACSEGAVDVVQALLRLGADPNYGDCLNNAARSGSTDVIRTLLLAGAIFDEDSKGRTPLHCLFEKNQAISVEEKQEMIQLLRGENREPKFLDTLFDDNGMNPLHIAAFYRDWNGIKALVRSGASPTALTDNVKPQTAYAILKKFEVWSLGSDAEIMCLLASKEPLV